MMREVAIIGVGAHPTGRFMEKPLKAIAYPAIWDALNDVLPKQGEIDLTKLRAMMALLGEFGMLKEPAATPERFIDLRYAKMAGIQ